MTASPTSGGAGSSDAFYSSIAPVDSFEKLARSASYLPLPSDWAVVAADVRNSTTAIDGGRYKHVNTVGVSVIAAVRNIVFVRSTCRTCSGATAPWVCVPERFAVECRQALAGTIAMAEASFGLELRACVVPVAWVRGQGYDVLVARHCVSAHYVQCALYGGGASHAERAL
jgi:hypothetical protein